MKELIEAFQIFLKYNDTDYPTHCEHDVMIVRVVDNKKDISKEDRVRLKELGFRWSDEYESYCSTKYGSC